MSLALALEGRVATLTIDRAARRNAFDLAMWEALPGLLDEAEAHRELRVLVIRSAVPAGAFCAGADIAEMLGHKDDAAFHARTQAAINAALHRLARFPLPTVAFIEGDCMGGGVGLAVACDLRVASPAARFAITPAKLGLVYPLHDVANLVSLVGAGQARRMLLTGLAIDAGEALRIGLVEQVSDSADDWISAIAGNSANSAMQLKRFVRRVIDGQSEDDADTLAIFAGAFSGADFVEGSSAFLEKRAARFGPRGA